MIYQLTVKQERPTICRTCQVKAGARKSGPKGPLSSSLQAHRFKAEDALALPQSFLLAFLSPALPF